MPVARCRPITLWVIAALVGGLAAVLAPSAGAVTARKLAPLHQVRKVNLRQLSAAPVGSSRLRLSPGALEMLQREQEGDRRGDPRAARPYVPGGRVVVDPVTDGFEGLSHSQQAFASGVELEPPDQGLCGGTASSTTYLFESVNDALALYDTDTNQRSPAVGLNSFYGLAPSFDPTTGKYGPFLSDPKCYFDPDTRRWFHSVLEIATDPATGAFASKAATLLAVSATSDPLGDYHIYSIDATDPGGPHCPCFGDQPLIGADANGFYVSTAEYNIDSSAGSFFNGAQIYALDKRALETGAPAPAVHIATGTTRTGTVQPATTPTGRYETAQGGTEYFLSGFDCLPPDCAVNPGPGDRITVWALTNTASLRSASPSVKLLTNTIRSLPYAGPVGQQQKPGFRPLGRSLSEPVPTVSANDDRMNQVVYADGRLWSGLNTSVRPGPRDGILWFSVLPTVRSRAVDATIADQGYVAASDAFLSFPSVGVNDRGRGVIAFSLMGQSYHPSAAWTPVGRGGADGAVRVAQLGSRPEDGFSCYPEFYPAGTPGPFQCRWGDYSASFALPNGDVWSATEYIGAGARTTSANWSTFVWPVRR